MCFSILTPKDVQSCARHPRTASVILGHQPMSKSSRARQLPAKSIGVLPWQRDFWLLVLDHVLAEQFGPPDLSRLGGFDAPAITQYTVTTPDLLRSFRNYNDGKPYHRQVRPFGFMVMFQHADDADADATARVIAPYNRNPAKAAWKAFNRDTGVPVRTSQLKTYASALRNYHNHPEAKFLNGERGDRGPTQRRHVTARAIVHIGKEANKLEPQAAMGVELGAQVEFHVDAGRAERMESITEGIMRYGPVRVAREASLSRKHLSALAAGTTSATEAALSQIERAISSLEVMEIRLSEEVVQALIYLRAECERAGIGLPPVGWASAPARSRASFRDSAKFHPNLQGGSA